MQLVIRLLRGLLFLSPLIACLGVIIYNSGAPTEEFGLLAMGMFVGIVVGIPLVITPGNINGLAALVGSAVGVVPLYLVQGIGKAIWMYPVGALIGLLWTLATNHQLPILFDGRSARKKTYFAWAIFISLFLFTMIFVVLSVLP